MGPDGSAPSNGEDAGAPSASGDAPPAAASARRADVQVARASTLQALRFALASRAVDLLVAVLDDAASGLDVGTLVERLVPDDGSVLVVLLDVGGAHALGAPAPPHVLSLPWPLASELLADVLRRARDHLVRRSSGPILVRTPSGERVVRPRDVAYVESDRRILHIRLEGGVVRTYGRLSEMARLLPPSFFQCHKSFLVNLAYVELLERDAVTLTTGDRVPVSQKRRRATREALAAYVGRVL